MNDFEVDRWYIVPMHGGDGIEVMFYVHHLNEKGFGWTHNRVGKVTECPWENYDDTHRLATISEISKKTHGI
jgi:hypothetical protein